MGVPLPVGFFSVTSNFPSPDDKIAQKIFAIILVLDVPWLHVQISCDTVICTLLCSAEFTALKTD